MLDSKSQKNHSRDRAPLELSPSQTRLILAALMIGVFLSAMDSTVLSALMPKVIRELGTAEQYSWPFIVYMLCSTIILPIGGRLADILGRRRILLSGMFLFAVASLACGYSRTMVDFLMSRAIQGFGSGLIFSVSAVVVADIFPLKLVPKYQGMVSSIYGFAAIAGPFAGGLLGDSAWGWRAAFLINLPLMGLSFFLGWLVLPKGTVVSASARTPIDGFGIVAMIGTLAPFLFALAVINKIYAWNSVEIGTLFLISLSMGILFFWIETRVASPLIRLRHFRVNPFGVFVILSFLINAVLYCGIVFTPLYLQEILGQTAFHSGMILAPMMLALIVAANICGRRIARTGSYRWMAGLGFLLATLSLLYLQQVGLQTRYFEITCAMIGLGAGLGMNLPIYAAATQYIFPHSELGSVTSSLQFFRSIGGTMGLAIFGLARVDFLNNRLSELMPNHLFQNVSLPFQKLNALERIHNNLRLSCLPADAACQLTLTDFKLAHVEALHRVFLIGAGLALLALILTLAHQEARWSHHGFGNRDGLGHENEKD